MVIIFFLNKGRYGVHKGKWGIHIKMVLLSAKLLKLHGAVNIA